MENLTAKYLLQKEIIEIRCKISKYEYNGSIPLEEIEVEFKLSTGQILLFPIHPKGELEFKAMFNPKLKKTFPQGIISKFLTPPNKLNQLKNKQIIGIWLVDDDFGEEICAIEFENNYFLIKGPMSPIGTGNADLFLFNSQVDLEKKYEGRLSKIY